jgi:hypothetical protein
MFFKKINWRKTVRNLFTPASQAPAHQQLTVQVVVVNADAAVVNRTRIFVDILKWQ